MGLRCAVGVIFSPRAGGASEVVILAPYYLAISLTVNPFAVFLVHYVLTIHDSHAGLVKLSVLAVVCAFLEGDYHRLHTRFVVINHGAVLQIVFVGDFVAEDAVVKPFLPYRIHLAAVETAFDFGSAALVVTFPESLLLVVLENARVIHLAVFKIYCIKSVAQTVFVIALLPDIAGVEVPRPQSRHLAVKVFAFVAYLVASLVINPMAVLYVVFKFALDVFEVFFAGGVGGVPNGVSVLLAEFVSDFAFEAAVGEEILMHAVAESHFVIALAHKFAVLAVRGPIAVALRIAHKTVGLHLTVFVPVGVFAVLNVLDASFCAALIISEYLARRLARLVGHQGRCFAVLVIRGPRRILQSVAVTALLLHGLFVGVISLKFAVAVLDHLSARIVEGVLHNALTVLAVFDGDEATHYVVIFPERILLIVVIKTFRLQCGVLVILFVWTCGAVVDYVSLVHKVAVFVIERHATVHYAHIEVGLLVFFAVAVIIRPATVFVPVLHIALRLLDGFVFVVIGNGVLVLRPSH